MLIQLNLIKDLVFFNASKPSIADNRVFTLPDPPVYVSDRDLQNTTGEQEDSTGSFSYQDAEGKLQHSVTAVHTIVSILLRDTRASKDLFESFVESSCTEIVGIRTILSEFTAVRHRTVVEDELQLAFTNRTNMSATVRQDIAEYMLATTDGNISTPLEPAVSLKSTPLQSKLCSPLQSAHKGGTPLASLIKTVAPESYSGKEDERTFIRIRNIIASICRMMLVAGVNSSGEMVDVSKCF